MPIIAKTYYVQLLSNTNYTRLSFILYDQDCCSLLLPGAVTNLVVIPQSSLLSVSNHRRVSNAFGVSSLNKYPQPPNSSKEKIPLLSSCHFLKGNHTTHSGQQIYDTEVSLFLLHTYMHATLRHMHTHMRTTHTHRKMVYDLASNVVLYA